MSVEFLKKATKNSCKPEKKTHVSVVTDMLDAIESGGEDKVREYAENLDNYTGNIVVIPEEIADATVKVPEQLKDDIRFAYERVRLFAEQQRASMTEFESEITPELILRTTVDSCRNGRMLCPRRSLRPCCFGDHEYHHSEGCRSQ